MSRRYWTVAAGVGGAAARPSSQLHKKFWHIFMCCLKDLPSNQHNLQLYSIFLSWPVLAGRCPSPCRSLRAERTRARWQRTPGPARGWWRRPADQSELSTVSSPPITAHLAPELGVAQPRPHAVNTAPLPVRHAQHVLATKSLLNLYI